MNSNYGGKKSALGEYGMNTWIVSIIDKSGSMESIRNDAVGGYNAFLREQQEVPGKALVTTVFFSSPGREKIFDEGIDINKARRLTTKNYVPAGNTALLDAIGHTIERINHKLLHTSKEHQPDKIVVAILTDGEENSSQEYCKSCITEMIDHQQSQHDWGFIYLAANQDAIATGTSYGFVASNCFNFTPDPVGTRNAYASYSSVTTLMRTEGK